MADQVKRRLKAEVVGERKRKAKRSRQLVLRLLCECNMYDMFMSEIFRVWRSVIIVPVESIVI